MLTLRNLAKFKRKQNPDLAAKLTKMSGDSLGHLMAPLSDSEDKADKVHVISGRRGLGKSTRSNKE